MKFLRFLAWIKSFCQHITVSCRKFLVCAHFSRIPRKNLGCFRKNTIQYFAQPIKPLFIFMSLVEGALLKNLTINSLVGFPFSIALRNLPLTGFCPSNLDVSFNTILWRFCLCKTLLRSGMTWFLTRASFNLPSVTRSIFFLQMLPYFPN